MEPLPSPRCAPNSVLESEFNELRSVGSFRCWANPERERIASLFQHHSHERGLLKRGVAIEKCGSLRYVVVPRDFSTPRFVAWRCDDPCDPLCRRAQASPVIRRVESLLWTGEGRFLQLFVVTQRARKRETFVHAHERLRQSMGLLKRTPNWVERELGWFQLVESTWSHSVGGPHMHLNVLAQGLRVTEHELAMMWLRATGEEAHKVSAECVTRDRIAPVLSYFHKPLALPDPALVRYAVEMCGARLRSMGGSWFGDLRRSAAALRISGTKYGTIAAQADRAPDGTVPRSAAPAPPAAPSDGSRSDAAASAAAGDLRRDLPELRGLAPEERGGEESGAGGVDALLSETEAGVACEEEVRGGEEADGSESGDAEDEGESEWEQLYAWELEERARTDVRYAAALAAAREEVRKRRRRLELARWGW